MADYALRPLRVFFCYASQDKPVVHELSQRLFAEGWIDPWVDEKKLLPGQDWRLKIEEAVETSDIVIICLSSNSVTKEGFVQKELRYAREIALEKPDETIFLIPLRLDNCETPRGLRFFQWADYFGERKDETYSLLIKSLKLRYEQKLSIEAERANKEKERQEEQETTKKAEYKKVVKTTGEKAKRDVTEEAKRERVTRRAVLIDALRETYSKFFSAFWLTLSKAKPFLRIGGIIGIFLISIWVASLAVTPLFSPGPILEPSLTATKTPVSATSTFTVAAPETITPSVTSVVATDTPFILPSTSTSSPGSRVNLENFNKIKPGMTYDQVRDILGEGIPQSTGQQQSVYDWLGEGNKRITVVFSHGSAATILQQGLEQTAGIVDPSKVTFENFNKIKPGMTYEEVKVILGEGLPQSIGSLQSVYDWPGEGNKRITVVFSRGVAATILQQGLSP